MNVRIRKARIEDIKQVNAIAKQVHQLHVKFRPDIYKDINVIFSNEDFKEVLDKGLFFVGEIHQTIVSYAVCFIKESNLPLAVKRKVLFIDALGNDTQYRNKGIGKAIMHAIFDCAKENHCDSVELQVSSNNEDAIAFYKYLGLQEKAKILEIKV